jgi:hypothetical protein
MQSCRISRLSNEVDKLNQQLRNRLQTSANMGYTKRGQTELAPGRKELRKRGSRGRRFRTFGFRAYFRIRRGE